MTSRAARAALLAALVLLGAGIAGLTGKALSVAAERVVDGGRAARVPAMGEIALRSVSPPGSHRGRSTAMPGSPAMPAEQHRAPARPLGAIEAGEAVDWRGQIGAAPASRGSRVVQGSTAGRSWRLLVPSAAEEQEPLPLVVALHGCGQTPEDFARGTRLDASAERRRLLVLYPAQGRRDNPSRCWNWFDSRHQGPEAGEAAQILAAMDEVMRTHAVRPEARIVLGLSAGGFMAVNLACAAPDIWAGVGVAAGGPYRCGVGTAGALRCMRGMGLDPAASAVACGARASRPRDFRVSLWHGETDSVVSVANLAALGAMFARIAGATGSTGERTEDAERMVYRDAAGRAVVETWRVAAMGHAWSGGDPRGTHTFPPGPDATEHMLNFLLPGARPAATVPPFPAAVSSPPVPTGLGLSP